MGTEAEGERGQDAENEPRKDKGRILRAKERNNRGKRGKTLYKGGGRVLADDRHKRVWKKNGGRNRRKKEREMSERGSQGKEDERSRGANR